MRLLTLIALAILLAAPAFGQGERFDALVRRDVVAGVNGDAAALDRAVKTCEDALARNPKHAEALVWHGAALLALAGQAFQSGAFARGGELWSKGLSEMDAAVALEPDNPSVLVPRGSTLLQVSKAVPAPDVARELLAKGVADFEKLAPGLDRMPAGARAHVLGGLVDGWRRLGDEAKAKAYEELAGRPAGQ